MIYFYQKIIVIDPILAELHLLDLSDEEKHHLTNLLDSSIYHAILDEILSNLKTQDKKLFLKLLHENPEDEKLLKFLKEKIENVEERIKKVADELVTQMYKDLKEVKKVK